MPGDPSSPVKPADQSAFECPCPAAHVEPQMAPDSHNSRRGVGALPPTPCPQANTPREATGMHNTNTTTTTTTGKMASSVGDKGADRTVSEADGDPDNSTGSDEDDEGNKDRPKPFRRMQGAQIRAVPRSASPPIRRRRIANLATLFLLTHYFYVTLPTDKVAVLGGPLLLPSPNITHALNGEEQIITECFFHLAQRQRRVGISPRRSGKAK